MAKSLVEWLKEIGLEPHGEGLLRKDGTILPLTKDEMLARSIWERALGYTEEIVQEDGTIQYRVIPPDAKAQQFLIERREGKYVQPPESKQESTQLVEKISDMIKTQINAEVEELVKND